LPATAPCAALVRHASSNASGSSGSSPLSDSGQLRAAPLDTVSRSDVDAAATAAISAGDPGIIAAAADFLVSAHSTLSMDGSLFSWTVMLAMTAVLARTVSVPLLYYAQVQHMRATLASPELARIQSYLRGAPGSLVQKYVTFRRLRGVALRSAGTSPARLLPWFAVVNVPVFVTASLAIRKIAENPPESWAAAGPANWFPDLSSADPTGVLPIANTALWLLNAHNRSTRGIGGRKTDDGDTGDRSPKAESRPAARISQSLLSGEAMTVTLQALALFSYPFVQGVPAGMFVFWITSGVLTAAQRAALSSDAVRAAIGLPTAEQVAAAARGRGPPVLQAAGSAVRDFRAQLEFVQSEILSNFANRKPGEALRVEVDGALCRARRNGKIGFDLTAVIRVDEDTGRKYIAVVKKGA
jgi:membrane protein insertase Oxa1/YidC/SpoIIIJ